MTESAKTTATTKPESLRANLFPKQGVLLRPASSVPGASLQLAALHRTLGNQAVGRLVRQSAVGSQKSGVIQAKLSINKPNDIYEQEADRVAEQVLNSGGEKQQSGLGSREPRVRESGIIQTQPG